MVMKNQSSGSKDKYKERKTQLVLEKSYNEPVQCKMGRGGSAPGAAWVIALVLTQRVLVIPLANL